MTDAPPLDTSDEQTIPFEEAVDRVSAEPDTLLPNEDPDTPYSDDIEHWCSVYQELWEFKRQLLEKADEGLGQLQGAARREGMADTVMLRRQAQRYEARLTFWRARQRASKGNRGGEDAKGS